MDVPSTEAEVAQWAAEVTAVWGRRRTWEREQCTGASFAFHGAFLVMFFFMPPRPPSLTPELLPRDQRQARALIEKPVVFSIRLGTGGGTGTRHVGEQGTMGAPERPRRDGRFAIEGHARASEARAGSSASSLDASMVGVIGVLAQTAAASALDVPLSSGSAMGADSMSALGALMGDQIGDTNGAGGLGLRGTGRGAGGSGLGTVGLGTLGTLGHGAGPGLGQGYGSGYGSGAGGFRGRASGVPRCNCGDADTRGGLSRESVRRVIRQHVNEVRFCYEQGLIERPDLAGRVTVTFLVAPAGTVSTSSVTSSTIEDRAVQSCVASAVRRWGFPESEGPTMVTYPLVFDSAP